MDSQTATSTTQPVKAIKKPGILINRNFALLWVGQAISFSGDVVFDTTLVLWVATQLARGQQWTPLAVGGVFLSAVLPMFVVAPFAGVFVDSWPDKRKTMLRMYSASSLLILLLFPLTGLVPLPFLAADHLPIWWRLGAIYAITLLVGTLAQFFNPSEMALLSDIVDEPYRARATGLHSLTLHLAELLGPVLGAVFFFSVGIQWSLLLDALSFVVAFLAILSLHVPAQKSSVEEESAPEKQGTLIGEFREGLRFFTASRILVTLIITGVLLELCTGTRNTLGIFFLAENLHMAARFYGFLGTAFGGGLIIGAALAGTFGQRIGFARMYWLSAVGYGLLLILYARMTSFAPALVVLFLQGTINGVTEVLMISLVIQVSGRDFVGRALSVFSPAYGLALVLSTVFAGYLASILLHGFHLTLFGIAFGPIDTIFLAIGIIAIAGGLYALVTLRGVKLTREEKHIPLLGRSGDISPH